MQDFLHFFQLGWYYILDWRGYEHILFIVALAALYIINDWTRVLMLMLIFTIGQGIGLTLTLFNYFNINAVFTAFLIPLTILIITGSNILNKRPKPKSINLKYFVVLFFGLIHGLSFSGGLKNLLSKSSGLILKIPSFILGLGAAQAAIALAVLAIAFILGVIIKLKRWDWTFFISSAAFGIAFVMAAERFAAALSHLPR